MAWTSTDLANIDAAIATGAKRVKFQDREVEYQSMADMLSARSVIANELAQQSGPPQVRTIRIFTKSGW